MKKEIIHEPKKAEKPPELIKEPENEMDRLARILARANPEASEEKIKEEAAGIAKTVPGEVKTKPQIQDEERIEPPEIAGNEDKIFDS